MQQLRHYAAACVIVFVALVASASPATAHTGFESSDPADGAVLDAPVDVITLVFTGDAEPTGGGFEVLEPNGEILQPTESSTVDGRTWVLRFDPPLSGGAVGLRWMVKAPDAHPIDGSFSFTTPEAISQPLVARPVVEETPAAFEEFLETGPDEGGSARRIGAAGRFVTLVGTLVGVGGLVFVATAMRGRRSEVRHVLFWVRRAGVIVALGAIAEFVAQVAIESASDWSAVWSPSAVGAVAWSTFGIATALRLGGGLALASGPRLETVAASEVADPLAAIGVLVGSGRTAEHVGTGSLDGEPASAQFDGAQAGSSGASGQHAWRPGVDSAGGALGAVAVVAAHLFDGHTVTKGNRLLTGATDAIHVAGGAVWAGGVMMLVLVLWRRHRRGHDLRARQLALRFSVVATIALIVVGLAGVLLTIIVLDRPSELWSTDWGRVLIVKTLFVGVAALAGGYNHKILIPQLDVAPNDVELAHRFRNVVTAEAIALVAVAVSTAFLMGAAS